MVRAAGREAEGTYISFSEGLRRQIQQATAAAAVVALGLYGAYARWFEQQRWQAHSTVLHRLRRQIQQPMVAAAVALAVAALVLYGAYAHWFEQQR
jgi:hypothetical protein